MRTVDPLFPMEEKIPKRVEDLVVVVILCFKAKWRAGVVSKVNQ